MRLTLVEDASVKTACTDGKVIKFNPDFVMSLTYGQRITLVAHETMHVALMHHLRRFNRDFERFNIAGDHVIDNILENERFEPIDGWLCDSRFAGMSIEQVYPLIDDERKEREKEKVIGDVEDATSDDGDALDESERIQQECDERASLRQCAQIAKKAGTMSGGLQDIIHEAISPKNRDIEDIISHYLDEQNKSDYSWEVPDEQYLNRNLYVPSLFSEESGLVVFSIDTSGSLDDRELAFFEAKVNRVLSMHRGLSALVLYCDTQVNKIEEFNAGELVRFEAASRGGTDFAPVFRKLEEINVEPKLLVYFTDLDGPCEVNAPEYPIIWACTSAYKTQADVKFGEVLTLSMQ